jgi:hypothetical protein
MDESLKRWRCGDGHTLGFVRRNGSGVRQLMLLREAIGEEPAKAASPEGGTEVDVMAVVEGYVADVRCSICGAVRTWVPGEEALRKMMESAARRGDVEARR